MSFFRKFTTPGDFALFIARFCVGKFLRQREVAAGFLDMISQQWKNNKKSRANLVNLVN
jgi:hypothetical protein